MRARLVEGACWGVNSALLIVFLIGNRWLCQTALGGGFVSFWEERARRGGYRSLVAGRRSPRSESDGGVRINVAALAEGKRAGCRCLETNVS